MIISVHTVILDLYLDGHMIWYSDMLALASRFDTHQKRSMKTLLLLLTIS
jgi:hypothetical protein